MGQKEEDRKRWKEVPERDMTARGLKRLDAQHYARYRHRLQKTDPCVRGKSAGLQEQQEDTQF